MIIENKKVVSFDLDMTLLDHQHGSRIPDSALETINRLRTQYKIVLATGRNMHYGIGESLLQLIRPDAIIHMNGARVEENNTYLASYPLPEDVIQRLVKEAQESGWCVGTHIEGKYCCTCPEQIRQREEEMFGRSNRELGSFTKILEQEQLFGMNAIENSKVIAEMQKVYPELSFKQYGAKYGCDIIRQGVSKAEGMKILLDKWGLTFENIIAVGDSTNDIELLTAAGIGIAMGNAEDKVKQIADYITEDIGEAGIQKAFQYLKMI